MKALLNFFPKYAYLHLRKTITHAAVNTKAKGQVLTRSVSVDNKLVGFINGALIAVTRDIPHDNLLAGLNGLATQDIVFGRLTTHVG